LDLAWELTAGLVDIGAFGGGLGFGPLEGAFSRPKPGQLSTS